MLDATELRRASATDASAVQQYLQSIDSDDLDLLLDQFADAESKKKESDDSDDAHEWLALVHVLLRTRATRQRTATRIIQSLWRGNASELEALRWITEISLGYMASVSSTASTTTASEANAIAKELHVMLQIVFQFVRDVLAPPSRESAPNMKKTLPQLLALVPVLLNLLVDVTSRGNPANKLQDGKQDDTDTVHDDTSGVAVVLDEHVVQLLELPWELRSVSYLLELLRDHSTLVSPHGWTQLRENLEQLIRAAHEELPSDSLNPLIRECLSLAATHGGDFNDTAADTDTNTAMATPWIHVARALLRRLPSHLRQEAEFNVQMCLHQNPTLASQLCDALRLLASPDSTAATTRASTAIATASPLDTSDAVLLLHAVRASKPLLHHHLIGGFGFSGSGSGSGSGSAADALSVLGTAQRILRTILSAETQEDAGALSSKRLRHAVTLIVEFGGRQPHARVWKAQLLHEIARCWTRSDDLSRNLSHGPSLGVLMTVDCLFTGVAEVREEILQNLLESARAQSQCERTDALQQLTKLVRHHTALVAPFRQRIEDWISVQSHAATTTTTTATHTTSAASTTMLAASFQATAPLVAASKDFFHFAMVFLRKHLSSPHAGDRILAVDVWCAWLTRSLSLDAQQEEEVVLAITHALQRETQHGSHHYHHQYHGNTAGGMIQRLTRVFTGEDHLDGRGRGCGLRVASLVACHRFLATLLRGFVEPASSTSGDSGVYDDNEMDHDGAAAGVSHDEQDEQDHEKDHAHERRALVRFDVASLDQWFAQNSAVASALALGSLLESVVSCLVAVELALRCHPIAMDDDTRLGSDVVRWISVLLRHREDFFLWISSGSTKTHDPHAQREQQLRVDDKRFAWALASRVSLGCAFCSLALRRDVASSRIWELVELQLCLARLWRKFSATAPLVSGSISLKDQFVETKLLHAAATSLGPHAGRLFQEMAVIVANGGSSGSSGRGASLDAMLFAIDAYAESLAVPQVVSSCGDGLAALYDAVVQSSAFRTSGDPVAGAETVFTTYAETLASQFPKSMRHLVVSDRATSLAVTLDARSADELLARVCHAMAKSLDTAAASATGTFSVDALQLLRDLKRVMDHEAFAKSRVACVLLVRRLVEMPPYKQDDASTDKTQETAEATYALLCDHVVHQPPLLRGLLALSFPTASSLCLRAQSTALDRASAVLDACGFLRACVDGDEKPVNKKNTKKKTAKTSKPNTPSPTKRNVQVRRKRLRQISDDEEDEQADNTHEYKRNGQDADEATSTESPPPHQQAPRLTSATSQTAALLAALSMVESIHSHATQRWLTACKPTKATRARSTRARATPATATATATELLLLRVVSRIHALLATSVFVSVDVSWISARALAKLLSVLETAVRIGKSCCTAARTTNTSLDRETHSSRQEQDEGTDQRLQGFESSVRLAVRGRAWLALLRDATSVATAKTKLSSTILKLDVFLLDVPTLVASLLRCDALCLGAKRRLRAFVPSVESDLASSTAANATANGSTGSKKSSSSSSSSTKRHLVGVVPIVHKKRRTRLRSRHAFIDSCLAEEDGDDAFADLEDFIA